MTRIILFNLKKYLIAYILHPTINWNETESGPGELFNLLLFTYLNCIEIHFNSFKFRRNFNVESHLIVEIFSTYSLKFYRSSTFLECQKCYQSHNWKKQLNFLSVSGWNGIPVYSNSNQSWNRNVWKFFNLRKTVKLRTCLIVLSADVVFLYSLE